MMYRLTKHRGGDDNFLRCAAFPIRDANLVETEYEFGYTVLYVIVQTLDCSRETLWLLAPADLLVGHVLLEMVNNP
jgi:hypothetical protein